MLYAGYFDYVIFHKKTVYTYLIWELIRNTLEYIDDIDTDTLNIGSINLRVDYLRKTQEIAPIIKNKMAFVKDRCHVHLCFN